MTDSQKQDVKVIIEFMFDGHMPQMEINERVAEVAWEMMQQAKTCSNGMDFVPRPTGFKPGLAYIVIQLTQIALRLRTGNGIYISCKSAVAYKWSHELQLAGMGM